MAIGDGQTGSYIIFLDKKIISVNTDADMGNAAAVLNKRGLVSATVVDELDETNWTSVTVTVKEGDTQTVFGPYSKEAKENLDTICYLIQLKFQ